MSDISTEDCNISKNIKGRYYLSNFQYNFKFYKDSKSNSTIIEWNTKEANVTKEQIDLEEEKINKFISLNQNNIELNSLKYSNYEDSLKLQIKEIENLEGSNVFKLYFENCGCLPDYSILRKLDVIRNDFSIIYKIFQKILLYLLEAEDSNTIFECIELEQIIFYDNLVKFIPDVGRIRNSFFIDGLNFYQSPIKHTHCEAPELYNQEVIKDARKLSVYSLGMVTLKLCDLLTLSDIEKIQTEYKINSSNNYLLSIASKLNSLCSNEQDQTQVGQFTKLIESCLTYNQEYRPSLSDVQNIVTNVINFNESLVQSIIVKESNLKFKNIPGININIRHIILDNEGRFNLNLNQLKAIFQIIENFIPNLQHKMAILNSFCKINPLYFQAYYESHNIWNFLYTRLSIPDIKILEKIVSTFQIQLVSLIVAENSFTGKIEFLGNSYNDNSQLFNQKNSDAFELLCKIISSSPFLQILKLDSLTNSASKANQIIQTIICMILENSSSSLTELSIAGIPLGNDPNCILTLSELPPTSLEKLTELNVYGCSINNFQANLLLNFLSELKSFSKLNIGSNRIEIDEEEIKDNKLKDFFKFFQVKHNNLIKLNISSNSINPYGIKIFSNLITNKLQSGQQLASKIESLFLGLLNYDDESLIYLMRVLSNISTLQFLDISKDVQIFDISENHEKTLILNEELASLLIRLKRLKKLNVKGWVFPLKDFNLILSKLPEKFNEIFIGGCRFIPEQTDEMIDRFIQIYPKIKVNFMQ